MLSCEVILGMLSRGYVWLDGICSDGRIDGELRKGRFLLGARAIARFGWSFGGA